MTVGDLKKKNSTIKPESEVKSSGEKPRRAQRFTEFTHVSWRKVEDMRVFETNANDTGCLESGSTKV